MKDLSTYIFERINPIPKHEKGIVVFDIDDTLLKVNPDVLKVYKKDPNTGKETTLTTAEFAIDPDTKDHKDWFDYRDFQDPKKVYDSILSATPLIKNLKIMDAYIKAGYDFCFLTARACEDVVTDALKKFLMYRDDDGNLQYLEKIFKEKYSHAINDEYRKYPGKSDAEKKANILRELCEEFDKVIFVDDDPKNIQSARGLNLKNLKVIQAWK